MHSGKNKKLVHEREKKHPSAFWSLVADSADSVTLRLLPGFKFFQGIAKQSPLPVDLWEEGKVTRLPAERCHAAAFTGTAAAAAATD